MMMRRPVYWGFAAYFLACVLTTAPLLAQSAAPVAVGTVLAENRPVTKALDFVGRIEAINKVEVRARVTGYLQEVLFKEGDKVLLFYNSGNRDEEVFADPFTFDIRRDPNPHVGFGGPGPHFCLGAHLARLESQIFFQMLYERISEVRLKGPGKKLPSYLFSGHVSLPIEWN